MNLSARITIHSTIVELDEIIPAILPTDQENEDVQQLMPCVFLHTDVVDVNTAWPGDDRKFQYFFSSFRSHHYQLEYLKKFEGLEYGEGVSGALVARETITLPRKNWHVPANRDDSMVINSQAPTIEYLLNGVYQNLAGLQVLKDGDDGLIFCLLHLKMRYVIGKERFSARPLGATVIGSMLRPNDLVPIISYTSWFENQTWNDFLVETLTVMLGQLAKNVNLRGRSVQDQEVFVVGFHGLHFHIARGFFTADVISRVHLEGCSELDIFELRFTRGYNLSLKSDWSEATRALARLFRYLWSGRAKVGIIQSMLENKKKKQYLDG